MNLNIGCCIYCGDQISALSREHVLPRGLGGGDTPEGHSTALVLQKASCEQCRQITQRIEGECLRNMMDFARARLGLKRKDRRESKMKAFLDLPDGSREERYINSNDILGPVVLPSFYEAGALTNKPLSASFECRRDLKVIVVAPARGEMLNYSRIGVELHCTPRSFGRMLAKIALGLTVAHFGVEGFVPTVRNFILNSPDECGYWVGGFAGTEKESPQTTQLHRVTIKGVTHLKSGDHIVVEVQLFAKYGGPNNYVVVGTAL